MEANYSFAQRLPQKYERFIEQICGQNWRISGCCEVEGALGVAICKVIIDTKEDDLFAIARHLGLTPDCLKEPYKRLSLNGYMKKNRLIDDEELKNGDTTAWCYLAGTASGATGACGTRD